MRPLKPPLALALLGTTMVLATACGRTDLDLVGGAGRADGALSSGGRSATAADGAVDLAGTGGGDAVAGRAGGTGGLPGTGGVGGTGGVRGSGGIIGTGGLRGSGGIIGTGGAKGSGSGGTGTGGGAPDGGTSDAAPDLRPTDGPSADVRPVDAARLDAPGPDLPPPTPGTLPCGAESCNTKTQSCCVSIAIGAVGARCIPSGSSCGGIPLACDEPADCGAGICCFGVQAQQGGGGLALGSLCSTRAACNGAGRYVVCRTNGDCDRAMPICCSSALGVPVCQRACP